MSPTTDLALPAKGAGMAMRILATASATVSEATAGAADLVDRIQRAIQVALRDITHDANPTVVVAKDPYSATGAELELPARSLKPIKSAFQGELEPE